MFHLRTGPWIALIASGLAAPGLVAQADAPVVINEFSYDDSGGDNHEFVELYNATPGPVDIGNWRIDGIDVTPPASNSIVIPAGTILASGDFYVIGETDVANVDLNQDSQGSFDWQNSTEALTLYDSSGNIVDTVMYEVATDGNGVFDTALAEGDDGFWGSFVSVTRSDVLFWSISRCHDGLDRGVNGLDFRATRATPGETNHLGDPSYCDDFDALAVEDPLPHWLGAFTDPVAIDPQLVGSNPNVIPASPQGGNAAVFWDPSGGGNYHSLTKGCSGLITFEAWVYFEGARAGQNPPDLSTEEYDTWSIGFGTEGYRYNAPDPTGTLGFTFNGNTGVSWTYQRLEADGTNTLYFIDHNDGGIGPQATSGPTILGSIPIVQGQNDGWQRLRIELNSGVVIGRFGGTYGSDLDGTAFMATLNQGSLGFWTGYREFLLDNSTARPPTMDAICLEPPPPECFHLLGTQFVSIPLPFSPQDRLRVIPFVAVPVDLTSNPAFAIPMDQNMVGLKLYSQIFMNNPVVFPDDPFKMSNGLEVTIGNSTGQSFGASTGMQLWLSEPAVPGGLYKIGFSID